MSPIFRRLLLPVWLCLSGLLLLPSGAAPARPAPASGKTAPAKKPAPEKAKAKTLARDPWLGAIVVDAADGRVLFEDKADAQGYPASVMKLMLLLTAMEQIQAGRLTLQDTVTVPAAAVSSEGASLKLKEGEVFTVEDLLYACMMHSANDAAMALATKLGGSPAGYVALINERARALGMVHTEFHGVSGLAPADPDGAFDVTTPRDLSLLCREVLKYPAALTFTSARSRVFRPDGGKARVRMETHNYILDMVPGCDGLKTGYIRAAGYCIAGTASRKGRRVIVVILGAISEESRNKLAARLLVRGLAAPAAPSASGQ